ncbi:hypothetical protein ACTXT7_009884 [Hymenolepis weldensis]
MAESRVGFAILTPSLATSHSFTLAYKLYEQQIRETLRSVGGSYTSAVTAATDDDAEYSCQNTYEDGRGCYGGGGGDSDMSDIEEIDNIPLHHPRVEPISPTRSVSDLLVDPKTLSGLPFSECISIDDRGDVDYRPMFSKILENNLKKSEERDSPQVIQTETGDFDYRKPPLPVVINKDQKTLQPTDPFGLGTHEDADLRQLKPPVSAQSPTPPIPEIPSDSDYRQLQFPQSQSVIVPATSHAYQWLNVTDSDLRQSSIVPVNTLVSPPPVAVTNTVTSNQTLSPFNATLPPPPSQLSTPVRPQVASMLPPFQTTLSLPSSAQITAMSHPPIPPQTYQPQQQQNSLSSQIPNIPEALLSTLQRTSSSQPSQQPAYQSSSSTLPVTTQSQYTFANQVVTTVASNNVGHNTETPKPQEDPFSIIFRITGLSDLIKSPGVELTGQKTSYKQLEYRKRHQI